MEKNYQARLKTPFGMLGIRCTEDALTGIDFLAPGVKPQAPRTALARKVCEQLAAYFAGPDFRFDLPLSTGGTTHQQKVWQAMRAIPRGQVTSYGEVAKQLHSSALAVGQACGANPIPIFIPCHRIVGKSSLGGFANHRDGDLLDIKRWLLAHEGAVIPAQAGIQSNKKSPQRGDKAKSMLSKSLDSGLRRNDGTR